MEYYVSVTAKLFVTTRHWVEAKDKKEARKIVQNKLAQQAKWNGVPDEISDDLWETLQDAGGFEFKYPMIGEVEEA